MKYYKTQTEIFGIEDGQENLVQSDWVEITIEEVLELQKLTPEQEMLNRVQEAKAYLNNTDWYFARLHDTGEEVPEEVRTKRAEAREFIRTNEISLGEING